MEFSVFSIFGKDNDTTNDTENNDADKDDNGTRNSTIFRMYSFS